MDWDWIESFYRFPRRLAEHLENHWVSPSYGGWVLMAIALSFFGAATNTMAGWLYAMSGVMLALLGITAFLAVRSIKTLRVNRRPIAPVSVGDEITVELGIENPSLQPVNWVEIQDILPFVLGKPQKTARETIPPSGFDSWIYHYPASKRGIYRWEQVNLHTGYPLGLFWCSRRRSAPAVAVVYPQVLPLRNCPLVDAIGQDPNRQLLNQERRSLMATEGMTRSLRPYRRGDATRLIHWRTSARYGELQVRELETFTAGQDLIIALDSGSPWQEAAFEQAVTAAASIYFYASQRQFNVKLWTAYTGLLSGHRIVLEALAATVPQEDAVAPPPPNLPLIWLTQSPESFHSLSANSRWLLWPQTDTNPTLQNSLHPGLLITDQTPLQTQLQSVPH